jgi:hypothetical protein
VINRIGLKYQINSYAKGKTWYWYIPFWLFGLYLFINLFSFELGGENNFFVTIGYNVDFMLHEVSHVFTAFLPSLITASAGSASELILGLALIFGAFKTRSYFASLFCFLWFMLACQSVAGYMTDARSQSLPLVSLGGALNGSDQATHDWNFIFGKLSLLESDKLIAGIVSTIGIIAGIFGLIFSAWIIYKIASSSSVPEMSDEEAQLLQASTNFSGYKAPPIDHYKKISKDEIYPVAKTGRLSDKNSEKER